MRGLIKDKAVKSIGKKPFRCMEKSMDAEGLVSQKQNNALVCLRSNKEPSSLELCEQGG
jgi:hypothetical protein